MSTNHTPNYNLCQWEATDQVLRSDFNQDNAKIDAALEGKIGRSEVIQVIEVTEPMEYVSFDTRTLDWSEWETITLLITPAKHYDTGTVSCTLTGHSAYSADDGIIKQGKIAGGVRLVFLPFHNPQGQVWALFFGASSGSSMAYCTFSELKQVNFHYHNTNASSTPIGTKLTVIGRR